MKAATCPICKINLSFSVQNNVRYCSSCKREFWPIQEQQTKSILEYDDLEAVGSDSGSATSSPVLLCDDSSLKAFPFGKDYHRMKKDYLAEHFPNTTITSQEYFPT